MSEETCWTLIRGAAAGGAVERDGFVRAYGPVIRAYLAARWRGTSWSGELDDALQEVFVDCLRDGGALGRVDSERPGGLRAFLFGLARRTAQKFEARGQRERARSGHESPPPEALVSDDASLSLVFDRAWVRALLQRAGELQQERARTAGGAALRRVELLRLRFQEELPIRAIAERWGEDVARLHREYARARREFREALREAVRFHEVAPAGGVDAECDRLLELLR